jgi:hypothetical protein
MQVETWLAHFVLFIVVSGSNQILININISKQSIFGGNQKTTKNALC